MKSSQLRRPGRPAAITYTALVVPTILVGIGATVWTPTAVFPVFAVLAALLCLTAVAVELRQSRVIAADLGAPGSESRRSLTRS
ncbi:hypothetical protein [Amycolatopsis keratiniphila]|uniref:hypothetical protein n=1 Tax=Amycolatopsis keratiniphila TaxID=129921 RepID=UPI0009079FCD|nr:hypothetical protein [Amycolatopsis keratiniphila]OLZ43657.1 hypothetical protein BS330_42385 [Amycolatopsis keratiniphila subsp. nogabecina]